MYWDIVHVKSINTDKLVRKLNSNPNIEVFIPKKEKWFHVKSVNDYDIEKLYSNYVFIKMTAEQEEFDNVFNNFFVSLEGELSLLKYQDVYALTKNEQQLFEKLFLESNIVTWSIGYKVNSRFVIEEGQLKDCEYKIIKVDKRGREGLLQYDLFSKNRLYVSPYEIISRL